MLKKQTLSKLVRKRSGVRLSNAGTPSYLCLLLWYRTDEVACGSGRGQSAVSRAQSVAEDQGNGTGSMGGSLGHHG